MFGLNGGIDAFQSSPIIGIGVDYRMLCPIISEGATDVECHSTS